MPAIAKGYLSGQAADQVSSYGPVKAESIRKYRELRAAQLHRSRNPASIVQIQGVA